MGFTDFTGDFITEHDSLSGWIYWQHLNRKPRCLPPNTRVACEFVHQPILRYLLVVLVSWVNDVDIAVENDGLTS